MPTGQGISDLLSGIGGSPVDRPKLDAYVANSQSINSLRSAQTEDAMLNAQRAQDEQIAAGQLEDAFVAAGARPADAHVMAVASRMHAGSAVQAMDMYKASNSARLGNPALLGTPDQTAAAQALKGGLLGATTLPDNFSLPAGVSAPTPMQSPQGVAHTADTQSQADLREAQARAGGYNPHTGAGAGGGAIDPNEVAYGAYTLYKTGKMLPMGMGNAGVRNALIAGAAQLSQREAAGENITNPGFEQAIQNGQDYVGSQRALNTFAGGPLANQTRAINNVVGHLQLMENLFTGLQNGDMQAINKLGAAWTKAFGGPIPTNVQTAASFIGPEMIKILSNNNSTGTAPEREEFSNTAANLANSPEQTLGAIGTLKNMLGRQATDLALQYHGATGRSDFAKRYVAPDVAQYLDLTPDVTGTAGPANPSAATPASAAGNVQLPPQAAAQLKEGIHTTFGNGQVWTLVKGKQTRVQ